MQILIATGNPRKRREIEELLRGLPFETVSPDEIPDLPEVVEDGRTFTENAVKKAKTLALASGMIALADDSGLAVDALDGAPGVFSARYAGTPSNDAANIKKLLRELGGVPPEKRTARFVCAIAAASGDKVLFTVRGECEGIVLDEPRGENGFGYDPLFFYPPKGKTFAELPPAEKNRVSHRGKALVLAKRKLAELV